MKIIIAVLLNLLVSSTAMSQNLDIKLKNIRYYLDEGCSKENPVKVRVCFSISSGNPSQLTMILRYSPTVTLTSEVKEVDNEGNVYYTFCSKMSETTNFEILFRDKKGRQSDNFAISATPEEYKIIEK